MASATPSIPTSSVLLSRVIAGFGGGLKLLGQKRPQEDTDRLHGRPRTNAEDSAPAEWNRFSGYSRDVDVECPPQQHLDSLSSEQIELLIGEMYRRYGFEIELGVARGAIGEGDLTLSRGGERILVRCRDWDVKRVGAERINEFCAAIAAQAADSGILVTSGKFTRNARSEANGKPLRLVEQESLEEAIETVAHPGEDMLAFGGWLDAFLDAAHFVDATCPACCSSMVLRSRGGRALDQWNCTMDPLCRGTRQARTSIAKAIAARDSEFVRV